MITYKYILIRPAGHLSPGGYGCGCEVSHVRHNGCGYGLMCRVSTWVGFSPPGGCPSLPSLLPPEEPTPTQKLDYSYKRLDRLGGPYIWHPPAILELLELRETLYTLKNTSKPTKVFSDQILRHSTTFVMLVLGLALERESERC